MSAANGGRFKLQKLEPIDWSGRESLSEAARDVLAERNRQISEEGWTPEHDDAHIDCELAAAAACYALCTEGNFLGLNYTGAHVWPGRWTFKDAGYRQNLVKAAALLIAEIERLDRKQERDE